MEQSRFEFVRLGAEDQGIVLADDAVWLIVATSYNRQSLMTVVKYLAQVADKWGAKLDADFVRQMLDHM